MSMEHWTVIAPVSKSLLGQKERFFTLVGILESRWTKFQCKCLGNVLALYLIIHWASASLSVTVVIYVAPRAAAGWSNLTDLCHSSRSVWQWTVNRVNWCLSSPLWRALLPINTVSWWISPNKTQHIAMNDELMSVWVLEWVCLINFW